MSQIQLTKQEQESIVAKLKTYFADELNHDLGQFEAEFLLEFLSKELGPYYYNCGLHDARAVFEERVQAIDDDLYAIEKRTD